MRLIAKYLLASVIIALAYSCKKDTPASERKKPSVVDSTQNETKLKYVLPDLSFNAELTKSSLKKWAEKSSATFIKETENTLVYKVDAQEINEIIYIRQDNKYCEAVLKVSSHAIIKDNDFYDYLKKNGFKRYNSTYWALDANDHILLDMGEENKLRDIRIFSTLENPKCFIPFTELGKKETPDEIRKKMEAKGYTYNAGQSKPLLLCFNTKNPDFPIFCIGINQTTKRTEGVAIYGASKYVYRSPDIVKYFMDNGFSPNAYSHPFHPVMDRIEDGLQMETIYASEIYSTSPGYIRIISTKEIPVELEAIDFPLFKFGATIEEIQKLEKERNRRTSVSSSGDILNAQTDNPFFPVHGYHFNSEGKCDYILTVMSDTSIPLNEQFRPLMESSGFKYLRQNPEEGTFSYIKNIENGFISSLVKYKSGSGKPMITYREFKNH